MGASGHSLPLLPLRRLMCEFLDASRRVPVVAIERTMPLAPVIDARQQSAARPSWFAIFMKAYAIVAARRPVLRQSYLSFPRPRLFQHAENVASLAIPRQHQGEDGVLMYLIRKPERYSLSEIDAKIRSARQDPLEDVPAFRRQIRFSRCPALLRRLGWWACLEAFGKYRGKWFGTFGLTGVAALGSVSHHMLTPLTAALTFGVIQPNGNTSVRLFYDHRIMDGIEPSKALEEVEGTLLGPIRAEMEGLALRQAS